MSYKITTDPALSPSNAQSMISFMESFYQTSDTEALHTKYVASFTDNATLIMGSKVANGSDGTLPYTPTHPILYCKQTANEKEILNLRHAIWTHVASRRHFPERIYFGAANELMLYGTVRYVLKADASREIEVPWAGRVVFDGEGEGLKMKFYQVYLDPTAQSGK
ncbi:hypothetical protein AWENTII_001498 [Aspergillus wentii]|nr:hypothetical protein MW887_010428 [Aspergillus wentii]